MFSLNTDTIVAAFTEWERRYREDPEQFASDQEQRALEAGTYGEIAASTLLDIIEDLQADRGRE